MISFGENIKSSSDELKKVSVKYLAEAIKNPKPQIEAKLRQLRIVRELNNAQYGQLKVQLPYIVCAIFNPAYRKVDNFAFTEYFIVDIDHIGDKGMDIDSVKQQIITDPRVMMCFVSPGNDGLKIFFKLKERCYNSTLYKTFYQLFVLQFSERYHLDQVIDTRTCDVTRACFISCDSAIYYNENSEPVDINEFIDSNKDIKLFNQVRREVKESIEERMPEEKAPTEVKLNEPDDDVMSRIRKTLNPSAKLQKEKANVYIPPALESIMEGLKLYIEEKGVDLYDVVNINYGKKLRFRLGAKTSEINLFYGKHGFTVVQTTKTGTNPELNALMKDVVEAFIVEKV